MSNHDQEDTRVDGGQSQTGRPTGSTASSHEAIRSYDDKQAGARLARCLGCGLWFWFTQRPEPDDCVACREAEARAK